MCTHFRILLCKTACWGSAPSPFDLHFQCRLRIPAERFLSDGSFRVIENLHKVRFSFCQRSIFHLFRDRRILKQTPHSCIHFASSFCASSATSRRTSGEVSVSRTQAAYHFSGSLSHFLFGAILQQPLLHIQTIQPEKVLTCNKFLRIKRKNY